VVYRDWFFLNALQNLQLIRFIECFNPLLSLFSGYLFPHQWEVLSDDPILSTIEHTKFTNQNHHFAVQVNSHMLSAEMQTHHLLLNLLEVLIRQGLHVKIVVETILYPGTYCHLGVGEQLLDSHGHHMGALQQQL